MSDLTDTITEAYDAANAEAAETPEETPEESPATETTAEESSTSEQAESTDQPTDQEPEAEAEESPRIPKGRLDQVIGQRDLYKQLYEETLTKPAAKTETETETTDQPDEFTALFEGAFEPATEEEARLYKMNLALHGQITQITKALDSVAPLLQTVLQKSLTETLHSQAMDQFNGTIGELETQLGTKLSDEDKQAILSKASTLGNMDVRSATLQGFIVTKHAPAAKKTDPRADILRGKDNLAGKATSSAPAPGAKAVSGDMDLKEALAETARELGIKTR